MDAWLWTVYGDLGGYMCDAERWWWCDHMMVIWCWNRPQMDLWDQIHGLLHLRLLQYCLSAWFLCNFTIVNWNWLGNLLWKYFLWTFWDRCHPKPVDVISVQFISKLACFIIPIRADGEGTVYFAIWQNLKPELGISRSWDWKYPGTGLKIGQLFFGGSIIYYSSLPQALSALARVPFAAFFWPFAFLTPAVAGWAGWHLWIFISAVTSVNPFKAKVDGGLMNLSLSYKRLAAFISFNILIN